MRAMSVAQWVPNNRLRGSFLAENPHVGGGLNGTFLSSNVTQVAGISGWNDLYGSMRPVGRVRRLALVNGSMTSPQWVPNGGWRWSFLAGKSPCRRGIQWPLVAYIATQVTVISGCSSLSGSMGPRAHTKDLSQALGGTCSVGL